MRYTYTRRNNPKIFLSGPMVDRDWKLVEEEFEKYEKLFSLLGFDVLNPCKFNHTNTEDRELTLKEDFRQLENAELIFMMPGWEEAKGCNAEWGYALACGIKVLKSGDHATLRIIMNYFCDKNPEAVEKEIDGTAKQAIKSTKPYPITIN